MLDTVDPVWLIPEEAGEYTSRSPDEEGLYFVGEWVIQCGVTPSEFEFCNYSAPAQDPDPAWFTYTWTCKARKLHEHPHISCIEERWVDTHAIVQVYRKRKVL